MLIWHPRGSFGVPLGSIGTLLDTCRCHWVFLFWSLDSLLGDFAYLTFLRPLSRFGHFGILLGTPFTLLLVPFGTLWEPLVSIRRSLGGIGHHVRGILNLLGLT